MKSIEIQGTKRESVGKSSARALRNAEQVPCVIYGEGEAIHFATAEKSFKNLVYTPEAHTVTVSLDNGETYQTILQDVQFHPVTDKILHADFYMLNEKKPVTMEIPVKLVGRAKGVVRGGVLRQNMRKLRIKSLPANLPDEIEIDVTPLNIGGKVYVESLRNDKYTILHPDNAVVAAVKMSRAAMKGGAAAMDDDE